MIPSLSYLLLGHTTLATPEDYTARLLEVCRRRAIPYENFQNLEDGGISLRQVFPCRLKHFISVSVSSYPSTPRATVNLVFFSYRWSRS